MQVLYLQQWVTESYHPYNLFSPRTQFMSLSIYLWEIKDSNEQDIETTGKSTFVLRIVERIMFKSYTFKGVVK